MKDITLEKLRKWREKGPHVDTILIGGCLRERSATAMAKQLVRCRELVTSILPKGAVHLVAEAVPRQAGVRKLNEILGMDAVIACAGMCSDNVRKRLYWLDWPLHASSHVSFGGKDAAPDETREVSGTAESLRFVSGERLTAPPLMMPGQAKHEVSPWPGTRSEGCHERAMADRPWAQTNTWRPATPDRREKVWRETRGVARRKPVEPPARGGLMDYGEEKTNRAEEGQGSGDELGLDDARGGSSFSASGDHFV